MTNEQKEILKRLMDKIASICTVNGWAFGDTKAVKLAYDHVFGAGAYEKLAGEVYDELSQN